MNRLAGDSGGGHDKYIMTKVQARREKGYFRKSRVIISRNLVATVPLLLEQGVFQLNKAVLIRPTPPSLTSQGPSLPNPLHVGTEQMSLPIHDIGGLLCVNR